MAYPGYMAGTSDTPRARQLGAEIKHARETAKIGFRDLARQLGISHSLLGHWEAARRVPSAEDLGGVLGIIGVTGAERDRLLELARDAGDPNWVAPGIDKSLAALIEYERSALDIFEANARLIPGLLQTSAYARAVMLAAGTHLSKVENRVLLRMGRRDVLQRQNPARFTAVIGEEALRYQPCDTATAVDQLRYLNKIGAQDNVTIQVVRLDAGYSPTMEGPFVLIQFEHGRPIVQLQHYRSTATITDQRDVADYQNAVDTIRRVAMSPEDTSRLIAEITDGMERTT